MHRKKEGVYELVQELTEFLQGSTRANFLDALTPFPSFRLVRASQMSRDLGKVAKLPCGCEPLTPQQPSSGFLRRDYRMHLHRRGQRP